MSRSWSLLLLAAIPWAAAAQEPDPVDLTPARTFTQEGFSRVRGVHELPDGRVLVADQIDEALYRVDLERQVREVLGRHGQGPGEYASPTSLYSFRGDSALLVDLSNGRLAVVAPDGSIPRTLPIFGEGTSLPEGADGQGNRYWDRVSAVRLAKREDPSADQAALERLSGSGGGVDTVAFLTIPGPGNPNAFPAWDDWSVAPDGWVAIVRNQDDYRVDWVQPDGTLRTGLPVDGYEPLRVSGADVEALRERPGGGAAAGVSFGGGAPRRPAPPDVPERFPPAQDIQATWDGRALVHRHQHLSDVRPVYDVFDRNGRRVTRVRLPEGRKVVGAGPSGVWAIHEDEVGFQWLELYVVP